MKRKISRASAFALSLALIGGGALSVGTAFTYATTIDSTADSWKTAANGNTAEGLKDDTVAIVEGVSDGTIQNNYEPRANTAVAVQEWKGSNLSSSADPNPFKFEIATLVAQTFGDGDPTAPIDDWKSGHEFSSKEIPGLFDGITFRYELDSDQPVYYFVGFDYTEMSPLAADPNDPNVTMGELGQWILPTTGQRQDDELRPGFDFELTSSFTPKADYIGSIPPLPLNVSGNGETKIVSLATKAAKKAYPRKYTSEGYLGSAQQNKTKGPTLFNLQKSSGSTVTLNYEYGITNPDGPNDEEAVLELKKDHGTYKVDESTGQVTFTPDSDFPEADYGKELEGVRIVNTASMAQDISDKKWASLQKSKPTNFQKRMLVARGWRLSISRK